MVIGITTVLIIAGAAVLGGALVGSQLFGNDATDVYVETGSGGITDYGGGGIPWMWIIILAVVAFAAWFFFLRKR